MEEACILTDTMLRLRIDIMQLMQRAHNPAVINQPFSSGNVTVQFNFRGHRTLCISYPQGINCNRPKAAVHIWYTRLLLCTATCFDCPDQPSSGGCRHMPHEVNCLKIYRCYWEVAPSVVPAVLFIYLFIASTLKSRSRISLSYKPKFAGRPSERSDAVSVPGQPAHGLVLQWTAGAEHMCMCSCDSNYSCLC
jgi:hypothetical protein